MDWSGLPQGQEKSGNQEKSEKTTRKNDKSQVKLEVFEKSQEKN